MSGRMTQADASRIQSAGDRNPSSNTATSGFKERAQGSGDRAANQMGGQGQGQGMGGMQGQQRVGQGSGQQGGRK